MSKQIVDIFSYSGLLGILGSVGKQNIAKADARGRENCFIFHQFS